MLERLSVSEFTTHRWNFCQDVVRYAAEGINQIGIWRTKMDDFDREEAVDLLFEMKMNVSSVHWAGGFTGADGRKFVDAVDDGIGAVQLAAQVGADCLIVHPGAQNIPIATLEEFSVRRSTTWRRRQLISVLALPSNQCLTLRRVRGPFIADSRKHLIFYRRLIRHTLV